MLNIFLFPNMSPREGRRYRMGKGTLRKERETSRKKRGHVRKGKGTGRN